MNKNLYFEEHIENQKTPAAYLKALRNSPYKEHQHWATILSNDFQLIERLKRERDTKEI